MFQILEEGGEPDVGGGSGGLTCFAMRDEDLSHFFNRWRMEMEYKATGSVSQSDD